jgi:hypothetical protein
MSARTPAVKAYPRNVPDTGRWRARPAGRRLVSWIVLLAGLIIGTTLRLSFLERQLWVDEAESSINALTILEHGYPTDHYLGLPIYENVLLTPTSHEEYEFKDPSYSDKGLAVYHGWLPLYSIAAAFALAGITPDRDDGNPPTVRHGVQELTRRTVVPRIPSILFAALFMIGGYGLGRATSGADTGWTLFVAAALADPFVSFGWQARYYSATLALTALGGWMIWRYLVHARWRDAVAAGLALVLLFHTHSLSFLILSVLLLACAPIMVGSRRDLMKLSATGVLVVLGLLPWMYFTGFLVEAARIPSAWEVVTFPHDFLSWFATRKAFAVIIGSMLTLVVLSRGERYRPQSRLMAAARTIRQPVYFAVAWFVIAYLAFMLLIPANSFYSQRLTLVLAIPGYLLLALSTAAASRAMAARGSVLLAPLLLLVFLGARGTVRFQFDHQPAPAHMQMFAELAGRWTLAPGTRVYSFPNSNLLLTYSLGLPVQSIAPIRTSFLDQYPGDIILLETGVPYSELADEEVRQIGAAYGSDLSAAEVRQMNLRVQREGARRYLEGRVAAIWPPSEPLGELERDILERTRTATLRRGEQMAAEFPLFRGFAPALMYDSQWAPVHYRFVDPAARVGDHANYRRRMREGTAIVLPSGSIVFDARRKRDLSLVDRDTYEALSDIVLKKAF